MHGRVNKLTVIQRWELDLRDFFFFFFLEEVTGGLKTGTDGGWCRSLKDAPISAQAWERSVYRELFLGQADVSFVVRARHFIRSDQMV